MKHESIPINRKALKINLDTEFYGSLAEIGGGQETARNFFIVGASSGTIAKSISAYDKSFSDKLYNNNNPGRYVSEHRLVKMLDQEYKELTEVLTLKKESVSFFSFADTVEVLNFSKDNYSHGWMGMKFQLRPGGKPNKVIIHVKLLENDTQLQQKTLGELGVNLIFACKYYYEKPDIFLKSLFDNLTVDRLRITMIRMSGPDLEFVDNRLLGVQLVKFGMTHSIMFDKSGDVQQPSDMLYKKNVLAFRGSFNPITYVAKDILNASMEMFQKDEDYTPENTLSFCEITLNNLLREGDIHERDFLERVNMLNDIGQNVMISDLREYYKLVDFFSQFKIQKLRIVMGVPSLELIFNEKYYTDLKGGLLEAVGKMFPKNIKLYIYPTIDEVSKTLITSKDIKLSDSAKLLCDYIVANKFILNIPGKIASQLHVKSYEVHKMIEKGNPEWEKYVPMIIAQKIKDKGLFGYSKKKLIE